MVTRYTKAWPDEVTRYIDGNITADVAMESLIILVSSIQPKKPQKPMMQHH